MLVVSLCSPSCMVSDVRSRKATCIGHTHTCSPRKQSCKPASQPLTHGRSVRKKPIGELQPAGSLQERKGQRATRRLLGLHSAGLGSPSYGGWTERGSVGALGRKRACGIGAQRCDCVLRGGFLPALLLSLFLACLQLFLAGSVKNFALLRLCVCV